MSHTAFQKALKKFRLSQSQAFHNIPCSHCGILQFPRETHWIDLDEEEIYALKSNLQIDLRVKQSENCIDQIPVCNNCSKNPVTMPEIGPWPKELIILPQRNRTYLSPLALQTNLGRTQGAGSSWNSYMTYCTVTGTLNPIALVKGTVGF